MPRLVLVDELGGSSEGTEREDARKGKTEAGASFDEADSKAIKRRESIVVFTVIAVVEFTHSYWNAAS